MCTRPEPRRDPRPMSPRRDVAASEMLAETLKLPRLVSRELQRLPETFSVMYGETH